MSNSKIALTSNELGIENPQRAYGAARLVEALGIGLMLLLSLLWLAAADDSKWLAALFWLTAPFSVVKQLIQALKALLSFFVPAGAPAGIRHGGHALRDLLLHRTIADTYDRPGILQALLHQFSGRFTFLLPPQRQLTRSLGRRLWQPIVLVPLLVLAAMGLVSWVLPLLIALVLFFDLVAGLLAVSVAVAQAPRTDVHESSSQLHDAGNPIDLYHDALAGIGHLREGQFQNRLYVQEPPEVGVRAGSNRFEAQILVETQPIPLVNPSGVPWDAWIMDAAGVLLGWAGWGLWACLPAFTTPADVAVAICSGFLFIALGRRCLASAYRLHNTFRFRSDLFWLHFTGSYVTSEVGIGDGRGGKFFSKKTRIQSDVHLEVRATRLVSLCTVPSSAEAHELRRLTRENGLEFAEQTYAAEAALDTPRYIVEAHLADVSFQRRLHTLLQQMKSYRDHAGHLAGIELAGQAVQQIVAANVQVDQINRQAALPGAAPVYPFPSEETGPDLLPSLIPTTPSPRAGSHPAPAEPSSSAEVILRHALREVLRKRVTSEMRAQIEGLVKLYNIPTERFRQIMREVRAELGQTGIVEGLS
jgi:hypothetical protein